MHFVVRLLLAAIAASMATAAPAQNVTAFRTTAAHDQPGSVLDLPARLVVEGAPLATALERLRESSGVSVAFSPSLLPLNGLKVTCICDASTVGEALGQLLARTPSITYTEVHGNIVVHRATAMPIQPRLAQLVHAGAEISAKPVASMVPTLVRNSRSLQNIQGTVRGRVLDAQTRQPISTTQVIVGDSLASVLTEANGTFVLENVPTGTHTITAHRIGYQTASQEITVTEGATTAVELLLGLAAVDLDEIVAIGYGQVRRRDMTGAIASISGEDALVKAAPNVAVADALQGRAAGVQVVTNSGAPGAGASVQVRGSSSISANSQPLYIIDGVPFGQGSSGTDNPLASIDPSNIESIQILKDASSTAIYGARGANGVVIITTQRGEPGDQRVQVEVSYGIGQIVEDIDVLNAQEFMTLANDANINVGRAPRYTQAEIDGAETYDYLGMLLRDARQVTSAVTVSGGDEQSRYLLSGSYLRQEGLITNTDYERFSGRLNLDRTISDRFRIGTSLSGSYSTRNIANAEDGDSNAGVTAALNFPPYVPPKDENGDWVKLAVTTDQTGNPIANQMEIQNPEFRTRVIGNVFGEYDLLSNLRLRTTFGGNFGFDSDRYYAPRTVSAGGVGGVAEREEEQSRELITENTVNYDRQVGPGGLELLGGFSVQTQHRESTSAESENFPVDQTGYYDLDSGSQINAPSSDVVDWSILSYFGRVNYNLFDRYLFTVTARRDGSSRFGANNKWATFPSGAFMWRAIEEEFLRDQSFLSDLRLRISYGSTGNQAVGEYESLAALNTNELGMGASSDTRIGLAPAETAPNPDLKWEIQKQFNAGVDLGFLNDRVALSLDAYRTVTSDLLLTVELPSVSGYSSQLRNIGSVRNQGIEFSLNTVNVDRDRFRWTSTLTLTANRNEVLDIGDVDRLTINGGPAGTTFVIEPGLPLSTMLGFEVLGLYQEGDDCGLVNTAECTPGEYKIQDTDGNGIINNADRVILGDAEPDFYGAFSNRLSYGDFTLNAFFNFSVGNDAWNQTNVRNSQTRGVYNARREVLDYWTPENTDTDIPRPNADRPQLAYSVYKEDASFVRLQTLTLEYQLPPQVLLGIGSARLYLTGENLWLLTNYTGFDPEMSTWGGDPRLQGIDNNAMPRPRTWNIGMDVTF